MADNKIVHELKDYKIAQVGPDREWDFNGNDGQTVYMKTFSIQLEGIADWVDLNIAAKSDAPKVGEEVRGHVEDAGKYGLKFVKEKKQGGGWQGGGKGAGLGAQWSAAFETASVIVAGYLQASDKKPKDIADFVSKVEQVAKVVKGKVDALANAAKKDEPVKSESESGESPTAPADNGVEIDDVDESELGKW